MTLDRAREPINAQVQLHSGYNRNAVRPILGEIACGYGRGAVDGLIRELDLEAAFGVEPGTDFSGVGRPSAGPAPSQPTQS
jgi:hypothetical protein